MSEDKEKLIELEAYLRWQPFYKYDPNGSPYTFEYKMGLPPLTFERYWINESSKTIKTIMDKCFETRTHPDFLEMMYLADAFGGDIYGYFKAADYFNGFFFDDPANIYFNSIVRNSIYKCFPLDTLNRIFDCDPSHIFEDGGDRLRVDQSFRIKEGFLFDNYPELKKLIMGEEVNKFLLISYFVKGATEKQWERFTYMFNMRFHLDDYHYEKGYFDPVDLNRIWQKEFSFPLFRHPEDRELSFKWLKMLCSVYLEEECNKILKTTSFKDFDPNTFNGDFDDSFCK